MSVVKKDMEKRIIIIEDIPLYFFINEEEINFVEFPVLFSEEFNSKIQINGIFSVLSQINFLENVYDFTSHVTMSLELSANQEKKIRTREKALNVINESVSFSFEEDITGFDFGYINFGVKSESRIILELEYLEVKLI